MPPLSLCLRDCGAVLTGHAAFGEAARLRAYSPECLTSAVLLPESFWGDSPSALPLDQIRAVSPALVAANLAIGCVAWRNLEKLAVAVNACRTVFDVQVQHWCGWLTVVSACRRTRAAARICRLRVVMAYRARSFLRIAYCLRGLWNFLRFKPNISKLQSCFKSIFCDSMAQMHAESA